MVPENQLTRPPAFTASEYVARQERVRQRAAERGFDALLIADPSNLYYLTGYDAWSFYTPQVLHLPVEGAPTLIMRAMDAHGAWRTATGIAASDIFGYPERLIHNATEHSGDWMGKLLGERGHGGRQRVGYEGEAHFFTIRTYLAFAAAQPQWSLEDCDDLVNWARLIKSPAEIEIMRGAGRVCTEVMRTAVAAMWPGRPQNEVAAEILAAQARGTVGTDGDYPAIVPLLPTGPGADTPHLTWTEEPTPVGAPISLELAGVHRRYHAPMARTVVIGRPPEDLKRLAAATVEGVNEALAAVRPGVLARDVSAAFTRVISAAGYEKTSRLGYSIGIGYPPDWGERTISIRSEEEAVLEENMTFHMIAGMWLADSGFELSEAIRVTDTGVELFTHAPRELITLEERRFR